MNADFKLIQDGEHQFDGKLIANGVYKYDQAHMTYGINVGSDKGVQNTYGVMVLYLPTWGDIHGYCLARSASKLSAMGILFLEAERKN